MTPIPWPLIGRVTRRRNQPAEPAVPPVVLPHCNGRHSPLDENVRACEWCDALTGAITTIRRLEAEVAALKETR